MGYRRGATVLPLQVQDRVDAMEFNYREGIRAMRHAVAQAEEGLLTPEEANCLVFAEATRLLGDGRPSV